MALLGRCVFRDKCELNCQVFVQNQKDGESLLTFFCVACGHLAAFHEQNVPFIVPCDGLIAHSKQFIWCLVLGFFIGKIRQWWPLKDLNRDKLRAPFEGNLHLHLHLIALLNIFYLLNPPSRIPLSVASLRIFSGRRFTHKGFNIMLPRSKFISAMFIVTFLSST